VRERTFAGDAAAEHVAGGGALDALEGVDFGGDRQLLSPQRRKLAHMAEIKKDKN
jgi:hypothetical protein